MDLGSVVDPRSGKDDGHVVVVAGGLNEEALLLSSKASSDLQSRQHPEDGKEARLVNCIEFEHF